MGKFSITHVELESVKKTVNILEDLFMENFDKKVLKTDELTSIAEGSFSKVYSFNGKYAIKTMKNNYCKYLDNIVEIVILNALKSEYIIKSYGFFVVDNKLSLIMENIPYNLDNYKFNNINDKIDVIKQLRDGLNFLHDNLFLHLDFTPSNILIKDENNRPRIYICDFSHSCKTFNLSVISTSHRIAPFYRPYENLKGSLIYSDKSDIWSLGIIIYEIINDIKIERNLMSIVTDLDYNPEMSITIFIERMLAWNKWPLNLKIEELDYSSFLDIEISNRGLKKETFIQKEQFQNKFNFSFNISSLVNVQSSHIYQLKTEELYRKILNFYTIEYLNGIFKNYECLYRFCFTIIYCLYNYPDMVMFYLNESHIPFMLKMVYDLKIELFEI